MSMTMMRILQPLILMMDIPLDMRQTDSLEGSGYFSKTAPATVLNSIHKLLFLQYPRKARGQLTVAGIVKIITIHSNHDKPL